MKSVIFILSMALTNHAVAGTESSGGGPSVFCPGSTSPAGIAQLYDFFEGRIRGGLNIPVSDSASKEDQAERALKKLEGMDYAIAQDVRAQYQNILRNINYLPDGVLMTSVNDLGTAEAPIVPATCQLAYAGFFESSGRVSVSRILYDHFTQTEKAGLLIHEALYAQSRNITNQRDSRSARFINAYLFSTSSQHLPYIEGALSTMRKYGNRGIVIPIQMNNVDRKLTFQATCAATQAGIDSFLWGPSLSLWGEVGGKNEYSLQGSQEPRINIKAGQGSTSAQTIPFRDSTRLIKVERNQLSRMGSCANAVVNLFYAGHQLATVPVDGLDFSIRLFPVR